ncbi:hypothetical protein LXA43DRAFT_1095079 [Ganoderma leucocontextum]|nr:hypothetical protein LXA43DRAFT_1095079 [Ganoderma leucocontextum]
MARKKATEAIATPVLGSMSEEASPSETMGSSRSIRASTRNRRPGIEAGLAPRLQTDIAAAAQKKRDQKAAKDKAKQHEKDVKGTRETAGTQAITAMLDERARQEADRVSRLDFLPSSDEEPLVAQRGQWWKMLTPTEMDNSLASLAALIQPGGAAASDRGRPQDGNKVSTPTDDTHVGFHSPNPADDDDDDLYLDSILPQNDADSAPDNSRNAMDLDDSQDLDSERPLAEPEETDGDKEGPVMPRQQQTGHGSARSRSARESEGQRGGKASSVAPHGPSEASPKSKRLTEAQKKKICVSQVRGQLDSARQVQTSVVPSLPSKRPAEPISAPKRTKKRKEDAFTPDYRSRVRDATVRAATAPSSPPNAVPQQDKCGLQFIDASPTSKSTAGPSSNPPPPSHPLWKYAPFAFEIHDEDNGSPGPNTSIDSRQHEHIALSDEEIGGFEDDDVTVLRQAVVTCPKPMPNSKVAIVPMAMIEGDEVVSASAKKPRAPRSQVSQTVSHAFFALDKWVQETVLVKIVPSLIELYGATENPWSLDDKSRLEFGTKLNGLLNKLHPNRAPHDTKAGDKIWRFTRQQVYDWRSNFGKLTIKTVKAEVKRRADQHGKPFAAAWVANALAKGGEATYSMPNLDHPKEARGALQTTYHIRLLTYHYEEADGSIVKTGYPIGALSLAVVAIRRAFRACTTGVYVPIKMEFSENELPDGGMLLC